MAFDAAQKQWVLEVFGLHAPDDAELQDAERNDAEPAGAAASAAAAKPSPGLQAWQRERTAVIGRLQQLESAIGDTGDPESTQALILIKSIIKNITAKPNTLSAVDDLERWLQHDDVLEDAEAPNPFGIELNLRAPLLAALGQLRPEMAQ